MSEADERDKGDEKARKSGLRRWLPLVARLLVFGGLISWFVLRVDLRSFASAFTSVPPLTFVPAMLLAIVVITIGGVRWQVLMGAFGARDLPSTLTTIRLFFVGLFYNTFVPGSVGGDVIRGIVTRHYFDKAAASYVVIVLERLIGFSAMGLVFLIGVIIGPDIIDVRDHLPWVALVIGLGLAVVIMGLISGRISRYIKQFPPLVRPIRLAWTFALSLISHFTGISVMFLLARGMELPLSYAALVMIMPVVFTASVIPLNVLGIGTREVTVVALLGLLEIEAERALALSLGYAVITLALAAVGGLLQLVGDTKSTVSKASDSSVETPNDVSKDFGE